MSDAVGIWLGCCIVGVGLLLYYGMFLIWQAIREADG